jgi:hypothetical protein
MLQEAFKQSGTEWLFQCYPITVYPFEPTIYKVNLLSMHSTIPFTTFEFTAIHPAGFAQTVSRNEVLRQIQKHFTTFLSDWSSID